MIKKIIITIGLVVVFFSGFHLLVANSDGYKISSAYLRENAEVIKVVGQVNDLQLVPLVSQVHDESSTGYATYHIRVVGEQSSATGIVTSIKTGGRWQVQKAHLVKPDNGILILKE